MLAGAPLPALSNTFGVRPPSNKSHERRPRPPNLVARTHQLVERPLRKLVGWPGQQIPSDRLGHGRSCYRLALHHRPPLWVSWIRHLSWQARLVIWVATIVCGVTGIGWLVALVVALKAPNMQKLSREEQRHRERAAMHDNVIRYKTFELRLPQQLKLWKRKTPGSAGAGIDVA